MSQTTQQQLTPKQLVEVYKWTQELRQQYPKEKYLIYVQQTPEGTKAIITERQATGPSVPPTVERGYYKAQQAEKQQQKQMVQEVTYVPPTVERGFYKSQQAEAVQQKEQTQRPAYEPQKVSAFYVEQKGLRRGVEVAPIETAREYAYYHPEKVWKAPYLYQSVRAFGEWLETEHAKTASGMIGVPSGARQLYLVSGFVKGAESLVRPEIRTAGGLIIQEPLGLVTRRPLGEAAGEYGKSIRGYEPELLGELVFDYLFGKYVIGPVVGKLASGAKRGVSWAGEKVASYVTETQAYQYIVEPAWRTGKEAFMTYGVEPAWRGIKTYVYEPLVYGITTYGYEPLKRGARAWALTYGLEPLKRGLTTYAYEPMKQTFVTYALPPVKETKIYIKSVLAPYVKETVSKYGIEPTKRGFTQYFIEPTKHEVLSMISPLDDWYRELKYGVQLRAWTFHPVATEAYRGITPTLGVVDLPYRGLKGSTPKPIVSYVPSKNMVALTEQVTKQATKITTKTALPKTIQTFVGAVAVKAPTILHAWKGEPYPFIKMGELGKQKLKAYPLEKFEFEPYPRALETLYPYQVEKWRAREKQEEKVISRVIPSLREGQFQLPKQEQRQLGIQKQVMAEIGATKLMEKQMLGQVQLLKQEQIQKTVMKMDFPEVLETKRKRKRKKKGRSPFHLYEEFVYPVATAKQFYRKVVK